MTNTTDIAALREALCKLKSAEGLRTLAAESIDQLEAERQRADRAHADMQFECDAHIETAESWREWKLRAVTAEAEIAALKAKLANPVVLPSRFKPEVSKVDVFKGSPVMKLDATGGWLNRTGVIVALNEAGFTVKGE